MYVKHSAYIIIAVPNLNETRKRIRIQFVKRIRDEIAFQNLSELKKQLQKDRVLAFNILLKD